MIKELENLVGKIEECATELEQIEIKITDIGDKKLNNIVEIALKGIKFEKIYNSKVTYNPRGFETGSITEEFFKKDGVYLRGIKVDINEIEKNTYGDGVNGVDRELWLMSDGTFKQFELSYSISYYQGARNDYDRNISKLNMSEFNIDIIIDNIKVALKERLEDLGSRSRKQQERLDKIEQFRIKD